MKKLISLFLLSLVCGSVFVACSDSKTYAEMLEDEKRAIDNFIKEHDIKVITATEFEKNGNVTDVSKREYVQLSNGVYMQIVEKMLPEGDSIVDRSVVTVRFKEYDIMGKDTTMSNIQHSEYLDVFDYNINDSYASGQFRIDEGIQGMMTYYVFTNSNRSQQVPEGWLTPLRYVGNNARVKLIVPSKAGHEPAMQYVTPYYYELTRIRLY